MSQRRACGVLRVNRSTDQYRSRRPGQAALAARIKETFETRIYYGYRRAHVQLRREGWTASHKKVHRIDNELEPRLEASKNLVG